MAAFSGSATCAMPALNNAPTSGCAAKYAKNSMPYACAKPYSPVLTVCSRSRYAFQTMSPLKNRRKSRSALALPIWSMAATGVNANLPRSSSAKTAWEASIRNKRCNASAWAPVAAASSAGLLGSRRTRSAIPSSAATASARAVNRGSRGGIHGGVQMVRRRGSHPRGGRSGRCAMCLATTPSTPSATSCVAPGCSSRSNRRRSMCWPISLPGVRGSSPSGSYSSSCGPTSSSRTRR